MRVNWNVAPNECDFGRIERVLRTELELQLELFVLVQRALGAFHANDPLGQILTNAFLIHVDSRRGLSYQRH